ncbi:hypothetical protein [Mycobacterium sp. PSTR-4-N]|uniref:hypothetical protein n=1 Tax=Mycobacterium sp. PSTR-4-N TaxID=2917745 RepID=UPI001F156542|nr:hypothetical protein [Mycobacterium sp. PSTR-4-N]MCG7592374.1 hypothetical protein [Mycobacterium sp. PSTR-4-N]
MPPIMFTAHADLKTVVGSGAVAGLAGTQFRFDLVIDPKGMLRYELAPRPLLLPWTRRVTGYIRSDGQMYDIEAVSAAPYDLEDPGTLGVKLPANDPTLELDRLQYRLTVVASHAGRTLPLQDIYFDAPHDDRPVYIPLESPRPGQPFGRGRPGWGLASAEVNSDGLLVLTREDNFDLNPTPISVSPAVSAAYTMTFGR